MYYTYILENSRGKLYIGQTNNIGNRLLRHNSNMVKSTKNSGPWSVIHLLEFATRAEAVTCEAYLKSLKSPKYIRAYILEKP